MVMSANKRQQANTTSVSEIDMECSICMELMVSPCTLPCNHTFCITCLRKSQQTHNRCAYCRYELPENYQFTVNRALNAKIARVARRNGSSEEIDFTVNECFDSIY